jgi:hypothetical protein
VKTACECADPGCAAHPRVGSCDAVGILLMRRVDHADGPGTLMCGGCRDYALESGRYDAGRLGARMVRERFGGR